jgi:hypothetical protein
MHKDALQRTSLLLLTLGPLLLPSGAAHGTSTGFIQARLVISAACQIDSGQQPASLGNPGLIDFGARGPTWDQALTSRVDEAGGEGSLQISCSPQVRAFSVRINGGLNGSDGVRRLSNGRELIPYQLAVDPAATAAMWSARPVPSPSAARSRCPCPSTAWWSRNRARCLPGCTATPSG